MYCSGLQISPATNLINFGPLLSGPGALLFFKFIIKLYIYTLVVGSQNILSLFGCSQYLYIFLVLLVFSFSTNFCPTVEKYVLKPLQTSVKLVTNLSFIFSFEIHLFLDLVVKTAYMIEVSPELFNRVRRK